MKFFKLKKATINCPICQVKNSATVKLIWLDSQAFFLISKFTIKVLSKKNKNICGNNYEGINRDKKSNSLKRSFLYYKPTIGEIVKEAKRVINHFFGNHF